MDFNSLIIALPVFFIFYQGIGLFLESRANKKWGALGEATPAPATSNAFREFTHLSGKISINRTILRYKKLHQRLELLLLRSGHPFGWKPENLLFFKEFFAVFLVFLMWRVDSTHPTMYIVALILGFWLPDVYMQSKVNARQSAIQKALPTFVDLMAMALESGMDFLAAVERIVEKMKPGSLREELAVLIQETRLGTPRKEALQHLAYRVNLPDIQSLTSIVIQSEELGTGLAGVLRNYAEDMRSKRILRAEDLAGKMPVKLLIPMMIFFFPIVFVIIFGPIAMSFMSGYK